MMGRCGIREQRTVIVPGLIEYRSPFSRGKGKEGKTLIVALGRVISASALGRLQEEHGHSTRSFLGNKLRFWHCKADHGSTTEAP